MEFEAAEAAAAEEEDVAILWEYEGARTTSLHSVPALALKLTAKRRFQ